MTDPVKLAVAIESGIPQESSHKWHSNQTCFPIMLFRGDRELIVAALRAYAEIARSASTGKANGP